MIMVSSSYGPPSNPPRLGASCEVSWSPPLATHHLLLAARSPHATLSLSPPYSNQYHLHHTLPPPPPQPPINITIIIIFIILPPPRARHLIYYRQYYSFSLSL